MSPRPLSLASAFFGFHRPEPQLMGETLRVQEETLDVCFGHTRKLPGSLVFQSLRWHRPVPGCASSTRSGFLQSDLS